MRFSRSSCGLLNRAVAGNDGMTEGCEFSAAAFLATAFRGHQWFAKHLIQRRHKLPGAAVGHIERPPTRRNGTMGGDLFKQLDLAGTKPPVLAEIDTNAELGHCYLILNNKVSIACNGASVQTGEQVSQRLVVILEDALRRPIEILVLAAFHTPHESTKAYGAKAYGNRDEKNKNVHAATITASCPRRQSQAGRLASFDRCGANRAWNFDAIKAKTVGDNDDRR